MNTRRNQLEQSPSDFLDWIWSEKHKGPGFVSWLNSDEKLFWISGKQASGKSTLMHHISCRERTRCQSILEAAHHTSWKALYFFFDLRGGQGVTNNLEGLFRSLLAQVYGMFSNSIPAVLKERNGIEKIKYMTILEMHCRLKDTINATPGGLCIFIDGLDEFDDSYGNLVDLIRGLTVEPQIKICMASRPELDLVSALAGVPRSVCKIGTRARFRIMLGIP